MAITNKVSKPALSPEWQVVVSIDASTAALKICSAEGTTFLTEAGTAGVSLPDGSYNGQSALIVNSGASGNKIVTPDSVFSGHLASVTLVLTKACQFIWCDDGTNNGWIAVGANA